MRGWLCRAAGTAALALLLGACSGSNEQASVIAFWTLGADLDSAVYVTTADGTGFRKLTTGWNSSWSPDGTRIVFVDGPDDSSADVYVIDADGSGRELVVRDGNEPVWSPDGRRIAFFRWSRDDSRDIYVHDLETGSERRLTDAGRIDDAPSWSPDGTRLVFSRRDAGPQFTPAQDRTSIYTIRVDGTGLTRLTHPGPRVWDQSPVWSPDGDLIAFDRLLVEGRDAGIGGQELYVIGSDGRGERLLTRGPGHACCPSWASDGTRIAFVGFAGGPGARVYIDVVNRDGTESRRLTRTGLDGDPAWSPDGAHIVFLSSRDDLSDVSVEQVYVMNTDGSDQHRVSRTNTDDLSPLFRPR
jgi:TolB protein